MKQGRSIKDTHLPAPMGGIDGVSPMSSKAPQTLPYAYNLIPGEKGLESRPGYQEWATTLNGVAPDAPVRTIIPYGGSTKNGLADRLFACTDLGIWDVTASGDDSGTVALFAEAVNDAGFGSAAVVTSAAGVRVLYYCDEQNGLWVYTESSGTWAQVIGDTTQAWAASTSYEVGDLVVSSGNVYLCDTDGISHASVAVTGTGSNISDGTTQWDYVGAAQSSVIGPSLADQRLGYAADPSTFAFVHVFKSRVWFVERDTARAWYLTAGSLYGTATSFNFGSRMSGPLRGLWSWTYDGGAGLDDSLVAISGAGDVVIYQGTDPASASTFGLKGVWSVGAVPEGRRFATSSGGELLILSALGLVPLSVLTRGAEKYDPGSSLTRAIGPLYQRLFNAYAGHRGWAVVPHPTANGLLIIVPVSDSGDTQQLFFSFASKGWFVWRDLPMLSAGTFGRELYFGTHDGRVCVQRGYVDDVQVDDSSDFDPVAYSGLTAFWNGGNARNKQVQFIRPILDSDVALPVCQATAKYDYDTVEPTPPSDTSTLTLPEGHLSSEDDADALYVWRFDSAPDDVTPSEPDGAGLNLSVGSSIGVGKIGGGLSLPNDVALEDAHAWTDDAAAITAIKAVLAAATCSIGCWISDYGIPPNTSRGVLMDCGQAGVPNASTLRVQINDAGGDNIGFSLSSDGFGNVVFKAVDSILNYELPRASIAGRAWHLGISKINAFTFYLYIDGVHVATNAALTNVSNPGDDFFRIGASASAIDALNATIDDFAIYSDARSAADWLADIARADPTARSGASAFGEAAWDTAVWDGRTVHQPLGGGSGMGRAIAVAFQGQAIGRTAIIGFDVQFTEGGSL